MLSFVTRIPPSANDYLGKRVIYNRITRRNEVQLYPTGKALAFRANTKKAIERAIKEQGWTTPDHNTYIVCEFVAYLPHKKRDSDNLFKCLLDAIKLTDIVYDDCMIIPRVKNVFIDKNNPRLEVSIHGIDKIGIFTTKEFESFIKNNCSSCKQYKRFKDRCGVLREAIENKISENINKDGCVKKKPL